MGGESQKKVEVIMADFPDDIRREINASILQIINELPFNVDAKGILVPEKDLEKVIDFVKSRIPGVLTMKSLDGSWLAFRAPQPKTPEAKTPETKTQETKAPSFQAPPIEIALPDEKVGEYYQDYREPRSHWENPDWPNLVEEAKSRALTASKPRGGRRYVREIIKTYGERFTYKGISVSVYKNNDPKKGLKSITELRKWKKEVDDGSTSSGR